jgi:hypothetical protein
MDQQDCLREFRIRRISQIIFRFCPNRLRIFSRRSRRLHHPAPPRGDTTGHRAGQEGGEPRLRKSSARLPQHPPIPCTVLHRPLLGPTGPSERRPTHHCRGCFCKRYIGGANNLREADVIVMSSGVTKLFQFILYFLLIKTLFYSICLTENSIVTF